MSRHGWNPNKPFTHDEQMKAVMEHGEKIVYSSRYSSTPSLLFPSHCSVFATVLAGRMLLPAIWEDAPQKRA